MKNKNIFYLILIIGLVAIGQLNNTFMTPSLPSIVKELGIDSSLIQFSMTIGLIFFGISQFFYGPISDSFGRIVAGKIGLSIFVIGSLICAVSNSILLFGIGKAIQGIGVGCVGVIGRAISRDVFSGKKFLKYTSYLSMGMAITPILSPAIGGFIQDLFGWRPIFYILCIFSSIFLYIISNHMDETVPEKSKFCIKNAFRNYKKVFRNKRFTGLCFVNMLSFSGEIAIVLCSPFITQNIFGLTAKDHGLLMLIAVPFCLLGGKFVAKLSNKVPTKKLTFLGVGTQCLSSMIMIMFAMGSLNSLSGLLIPMIGYAFGTGIVTPTSTAGAMELFPRNAGIAGAICGGIAMIGSGGVNSVMASFSDKNLMNLSLILGSVSFINLLLLCYINIYWNDDNEIIQERTLVLNE